MKKQVLMILKCNGLDYDDRVRKESLSLEKLGYQVDIHVLEDINEKNKGDIFNQNIFFTKYALISRMIFKGNKFLLVKLAEFFFRLLPTLIKKQGVIWLHDPLMFVFVPFLVLLKKLGRVENIVWDQHELPPSYFLRTKHLKAIYLWAMEHVDVRIHANKERAEYLNEKTNKNFSFEILRNFVDSTFINEQAEPLSKNIVDWLDNSSFILLQSGAHKERNFKSVVEAVCTDTKRKCIVVGGYDPKFISDLKGTYPEFDEYFYFVGMVPQIRLVDYIDKAEVSLILYNNSEPNSLLCEPNRLYQALSRGTPVIVGDNPTMKRIVTDLQCGLVINGNGDKSCQIKNALNEYKTLTYDVNDSIKNKFSWGSQECVFEFLINK